MSSENDKEPEKGDEGCCCCVPWKPVNRVVFACALFYFLFSGVVQYGLTGCTLVSVREHFSASNTTMGFAVSSFDGIQIVASIFLPQLEKRVQTSPEFMCAIGSLICFLGSLIWTVAQHISMLFISQIVAGIGGSAISVFISQMMARLVSQDSVGMAELSFALGKAYSTSPVGVMIASGGCIALGGGRENESWRILWGVGAVLNLVTAIPFFWIAWGYSRKHDPRVIPKAEPTLGMVKDKIVKDKKVMLVILASSTAIMCVAAFSFWLTAYGEEHLGLSSSQAPLLLLGAVPAAVIGMTIGGLIPKWRNWTGKPLVLYVSSTFFVALVIGQLILMLDVKIVPLFAVALVICMIFIFAEAGPTPTIIATALPSHMVSYGQSVTNIVTRAIGGFCGPPLLGALLDSGLPYNWAFSIVLWVLVIGGCLDLLAWKLTPEGTLAILEDESASSTMDTPAANAEAEKVSKEAEPIQNEQADGDEANTTAVVPVTTSLNTSRTGSESNLKHSASSAPGSPPRNLLGEQGPLGTSQQPQEDFSPNVSTSEDNHHGGADQTKGENGDPASFIIPPSSDPHYFNSSANGGNASTTGRSFGHSRSSNYEISTTNLPEL